MSSTLLSSPLLNERQAAELLGVTPGTLSVWRCTRRYPLPFIKVGRCVRYDRGALDNFLRRQMVGGEAAGQ